MSERFLTTVIVRVAREILLTEFRRHVWELLRSLRRTWEFCEGLLQFGIESVLESRWGSSF